MAMRRRSSSTCLCKPQASLKSTLQRNRLPEALTMRRRSSSRCSSCAPSIFWKSLGANAIGSIDSAAKKWGGSGPTCRRNTTTAGQGRAQSARLPRPSSLSAAPAPAQQPGQGPLSSTHWYLRRMCKRPKQGRQPKAQRSAAQATCHRRHTGASEGKRRRTCKLPAQRSTGNMPKAQHQRIRRQKAAEANGGARAKSQSGVATNRLTTNPTASGMPISAPAGQGARMTQQVRGGCIAAQLHSWRAPC